MIRKLFLALCVLALIGCGWWVFAAFGLKSSVQTWFDDRQREGWQAELSDVSLSGFPSRVAASLDTIALADPQSGLAMQFPDLDLSFRTLWPGDMRVDLPGSAVQIATPEGRWNVLAKDAQADLNLHPGSALELEAMALQSGPFLVEISDGPGVISGTALELSMIQTDSDTTYDLVFDIADFTPEDGIRTALLLPPDWPLVFDLMRAEAQITFDTTIDRVTLEEARPQPQKIDLKFAETRWADMRLFAAGTLTRDAVGYAEGSLTIKAENWQKMLDLAETAGILAPQRRPLVESVLSNLARTTGVTSDLDVTLDFENGLTRLGFLPLGRAPSMIVR